MINFKVEVVEDVSGFEFIIYVVTVGTADYGDAYVVLRQAIPGDGSVLSERKPFCIAKTYEEAVRLIPNGLHRIGRDSKDDPSIVECWI